MEVKKEASKQESEYNSRSKKVELNDARLRYNGIRQHKPRTAYEEDLMTARCYGTDIGDINQSRFFAKNLDIDIFDQMKEDLRCS